MPLPRIASLLTMPSSASAACCSNDQGYATALERCTSHGAYTVAVGTYLREAGFNWSARPSLLPVPQAANCIVAWHPGQATRKSAAERKLVASWQQRLGSGECCATDREAGSGRRLAAGCLECCRCRLVSWPPRC